MRVIVGVEGRDAGEHILIGLFRQEIAVNQRLLAEIGQKRVTRAVLLWRTDVPNIRCGLGLLARTRRCLNRSGYGLSCGLGSQRHGRKLSGLLQLHRIQILAKFFFAHVHASSLPFRQIRLITAPFLQSLTGALPVTALKSRKRVTDYI